jgi:hypothetical protein
VQFLAKVVTAELEVSGRASGAWCAAQPRGGAMNRLLVVQWWDQATPIPRGQLATLMLRSETHDLGDWKSIAVHPDPSGMYLVILVWRKVEQGTIRGLP